MPSWLPEGNTVLPTSDEMRTLGVWLGTLVSAAGNQPCRFYPEGCLPLPSDDEERLYHKICAMRGSAALGGNT